MSIGSMLNYVFKSFSMSVFQGFIFLFHFFHVSKVHVVGVSVCMYVKIGFTIFGSHANLLMSDIGGHSFPPAFLRMPYLVKNNKCFLKFYSFGLIAHIYKTNIFY